MIRLYAGFQEPGKAPGVILVGVGKNDTVQMRGTLLLQNAQQERNRILGTGVDQVSAFAAAQEQRVRFTDVDSQQ